MGNISKYIILNILAFVAGCLLIFTLSKSSANYDIKQLQEKNKALLLENNNLAKSNDSLKNNIESANVEIEALNNKDESLKQRVGQLNNKIESLKGKYEEANNHANNFSSLDIQGYFSELK